MNDERPKDLASKDVYAREREAAREVAAIIEKYPLPGQTPQAAREAADRLRWRHGITPRKTISLALAALERVISGRR